MCENINAEVAAGTITTVTEAIGYLSWTFYARRVKGNPSYYGLQSGSDDHVEAHFVKTIQDTIEKLQSQGCVDQRNDDQLSTTSLGLACCNYYLDHRSPKQMLFGIREARKIITGMLHVEGKRDEMDGASGQTLVPIPHRRRIEEVSCAWVLYTLCSTQYVRRSGHSTCIWFSNY